MAFSKFPHPKDPDAKLDYVVKWEDWLGIDTIATSTWEIPVGITKESDSIIATNTRTQIWLSGGTAGQSYTLVNHIITAGGREDERNVIIQIKER